MDLSQREYVCMACGLVIDRDLNAAKNLAQYDQQDAASSAESKNGRGGAISPAGTEAEPMKRLLESLPQQLSHAFA